MSRDQFSDITIIGKDDGHRFEFRCDGTLPVRVEASLISTPEDLIEHFYSYLALCGYDVSTKVLRLVDRKDERAKTVRTYQRGVRKLNARIGS